MTVICAWCSKILRVTSTHTDLVSHGICKKCAEKAEREYKEGKK